MPELTADLRAVRRGLPVRARSPSVRERLSRFFARNRLAVLSAAILLGLFVAATATISVLGVRSIQAGALAAANADEADRQRALAEAVQLFLEEMLVSARDLGENGRNVTMLDVLAATTGRLNAGALATEPEVEAEVRDILGRTYLSLAWAPQALEHFRWTADYRIATRPEGDPARLDALWHYGEALKESSYLEEAMSVFETFYAEALASHGETDHRVWDGLDQIGNTLFRLGRAGEALPYHERAYAGLSRIYGEGTLRTGASLFNIGGALAALGRLEEAEAPHIGAIAAFDSGDAESVASAIRARRHLGMRVYARLGRNADAERTLLEARDLASSHLGPMHGETAGVELSIGRFRRSQGRLAEARASFDAFYEFIKRSRSPFDYATMMARQEIASILIAQQHDPEALALYEEIERDARAALAQTDPAALPARTSLLHGVVASGARGRAQALLAQGLAEQAREAAETAIEHARLERPDDPASIQRIDAENLWCAARIAQDAPDEVLARLDTIRRAAIDRYGPDHRLTSRLTVTLADALQRLDRERESAQLFHAVSGALATDYGTAQLPRWAFEAGLTPAQTDDPPP